MSAESRQLTLYSRHVYIVSNRLASTPTSMHISLAYLLNHHSLWSLGNTILKKSAISLHTTLQKGHITLTTMNLQQRFKTQSVVIIEDIYTSTITLIRLS